MYIYPILSPLPVTVANENSQGSPTKRWEGSPPNTVQASLTKNSCILHSFKDFPISHQNKMPVAPVLRSPGRIRAGSDTADHDRTLQRVSKSYVIPLSIGYMYSLLPLKFNKKKPENRPSQKESSLPTIILQGLG